MTSKRFDFKASTILEKMGKYTMNKGLHLHFQLIQQNQLIKIASFLEVNEEKKNIPSLNIFTARMAR